jgi:hypothetical protein
MRKLELIRHPLITTILLLPLFALAGAAISQIKAQYLVAFLVASGLMGIGLLWTFLLAEGQEWMWLAKIFVGAFGLRLCIAFGLYIIWPGLEVPDGIHYAGDSQQLAAAWHNLGFMSYAEIVQVPLQAFGYVYLNTAVFFVLGPYSINMQVLNCFFAGLAAIYTYKIGSHYFDSKVARFATICTAFMPSMLFWTSQNLKDSIVLFLSMQVLWHASQGLRQSFYRIPMIGLIIAALATIRKETAIGLAVVIAVTLVFQSSSRPINRVFVSLASIIVLGITLSSSGYGFLGLEFAEERLNPTTITNIRERTSLGGSALNTTIDTSSVGGLLAYTPMAVANFMLRPWPWEATNSLTQIMTIPESIFLWYPLFGFVLVGLVHTWRTGWVRNSLIWVYVLAATIAAAPQYGNLGTAYRHRVQLWPCYFLLAGVGWYYWREKQRRQPEALSSAESPAELPTINV